MSCTIFGYINAIAVTDQFELQRKVKGITPFGFSFCQKIQLYNYPSDIQNRKDIAKFIVSDSDNSNTATILLEHSDYDPQDKHETEFQKQFPSLLQDRIMAITQILNLLLQNDKVSEFGVSISCCDEIERIEYCSQKSLADQVLTDCLKSCPPNTLYICKKLLPYSYNTLSCPHTTDSSVL